METIRNIITENQITLLIIVVALIVIFTAKVIYFYSTRRKLMVKNKKKYRNDKCSCGSGRKWKHCCMIQDPNKRTKIEFYSKSWLWKRL